jgi:uncharacterized protein YbjT (DUF2867 family)
MISRLEAGSLAVVFGGSGFVGRHTAAALAKHGWRVRAAVRRPQLAGHLQPLGAAGQIYAVQANLRYPDSLARAVEGAEAVVNAVGVLTPMGSQTFDAVHLCGVCAVAKAPRVVGAKCLVHVWALGADRRSGAHYARSKAEGEAAVLEQFPNAVVLRPSIVFGPEDEFFNRFAGLALRSPFLPLIGGGRSKFQPVFVGDLASAILTACEGNAKPGTIYEIGGPEILTLRQLLDKTQEWAGRKRLYFPMPFWYAKLVAAFTWPLPNSLRPITVDQVRMLETDNVVSEAARKDNRTLADLGIRSPRATGTVVPAYLERFRPHGQYSRYRG